VGTYRESQTVRIIQPQTGVDVFDASVKRPLPAGQLGTVVYVYGKGSAYEVEVILGSKNAEGFIDHPQYCTLTLTPDQVVPAN